jgi:hypothetical protein
MSTSFPDYDLNIWSHGTSVKCGTKVSSAGARRHRAECYDVEGDATRNVA